MKTFKFGLVITGIGFLITLLFISLNFIPSVDADKLTPMLLLGGGVFIFGTILLSLFYGDKLSRWLAVLVILSILFLLIPWDFDYTPVNIARNLYLLFGASIVFSWIWLVMGYRSKRTS